MVHQNPIFGALYCEEERFNDDNSESIIEDLTEIQKSPYAILLESDFLWEEEELKNLLFKEKNESPLKSARSEAFSWMLKVIRRYGFNAATATRFVTNRCFQREKPWMSWLSSRLSLTAKVKETQVPMSLFFGVNHPNPLFLLMHSKNEIREAKESVLVAFYRPSAPKASSNHALARDGCNLPPSLSADV
ncbi:cyclin-D3-1-like [Salvia miltiorrhiza]|uniref:cyclin-D3-1-like n=1 Tax=Salvia miltiorrhiza TaxID=226208 RepID=UPI0025AC26C1|nr:cyclin-D3-1-like [Salvia miltiorrhiza]